MKKIDHTGKKYGRLTALRFSHQIGNVKFWLYQCECGKQHITHDNQVTFGQIKSCGCLHREFAIKPRAGKHKLIHLPEYRIWAGMRVRCRNKGDRRYGGRGILVCKRWDDFTNFYADMGPRPSTKHSLDRIDNDGGYEPSNCRWATSKQQCVNRHNSKTINVDGKDMPLTQAAIALGIHYQTLYWRFKRGLPLVRAA